MTRRLEYNKVRLQLRRRTVRAPITGVVTKLHKQRGEFVAPNSPDVLTLVELDPLLANFTVMSPQATQLAVDQSIEVRFPGNGLETTGVVDFIAPVTDAESGTVQVKLRIENAEGLFRSGERCHITLID